MPERETNPVPINGRRRKPMTFDHAIEHVRDLSQNATLRPSPFKLKYVAPGEIDEADPAAKDTDTTP